MIAPDSRPSPYQGLRPFDEPDAPYFFGRERDSRLIAADLFAAPVTLLYGASGVGKSSVLRAGVVPLLRPREDLLVVVFAAWQTDPLSELKGTIARAIVATSQPGDANYETYRDTVLRIASEPLPQYVAACSALVKRRLMIVLDQFEEYSLYHPRESEFDSQFAAATRIGDLSASFLLSLREEAVARLDRFAGRIPALFHNYRRVDHLRRPDARRAISEPLAWFNRATGARMNIEPGLVEAVLDQVRVGRVTLPETARGFPLAGAERSEETGIETAYLQLVMTRVWNEEVGCGSSLLRARTLHDVGGAEDIVQRHLDGVMEEHLTGGERETAAALFHYLVTPSGTKVSHTGSDLAGYVSLPEQDVSAVLQKLAAGKDRILRVVVSPERPTVLRYEIFHDILGFAILDWRARFVRTQAEQRATKEATAMASAPTSRLRVDWGEEALGDGLALSLAGGGYRALLFHLGTLWRLHELGLLHRLSRIAGVSAGAIAVGLLGLKWGHLTSDRAGVATSFQGEIVDPLRALARKTIDVSSILLGVFLPGGDTGTRLAQSYRKHAFGDATLQDLPDMPNIVIGATNANTGALWRFSKAYMGDYRLGLISRPTTPLAEAVAASSAVAPMFSIELKLDPAQYERSAGTDLDPEEFGRRVVLVDGSIVDRLAVETTWKRYPTVLISDAGGRMRPETERRTDWVRLSSRVLELIDDNARALQKRQIIQSFQAGTRQGAYWGIWTDIADYGLPTALPCPKVRTAELAAIPARYAEIVPDLQERLINWGYAVCDAAVRRHLDPTSTMPPGFPYPKAAV